MPDSMPETPSEAPSGTPPEPGPGARPRAGDAPRAVVERYLRAGLDRPAPPDGDDGRADLFASDAILEFPFAPDGMPDRITGRERIRAVLAALRRAAGSGGGAGLTVDQAVSQMRAHQTTDPEVLVLEVNATLTDPAGATRQVRHVQVYTVRDGLIAGLRDYWPAGVGEFTRAALRGVA